MLFVRIFGNNLFTFSVSTLTLFNLSWFLRDGHFSILKRGCSLRSCLNFPGPLFCFVLYSMNSINFLFYFFFFYFPVLYLVYSLGVITVFTFVNALIVRLSNPGRGQEVPKILRTVSNIYRGCQKSTDVKKH